MKFCQRCQKVYIDVAVYCTDLLCLGYANKEQPLVVIESPGKHNENNKENKEEEEDSDG